MDKAIKIPEKGSKWVHRNGLVYSILFITNIGFRNNKYPITVVYEGQNGNLWSRPLTDWYRSFKPLTQTNEN